VVLLILLLRVPLLVVPAPLALVLMEPRVLLLLPLPAQAAVLLVRLGEEVRRTPRAVRAAQLVVLEPAVLEPAGLETEPAQPALLTHGRRCWLKPTFSLTNKRTLWPGPTAPHPGKLS
jgi:hypothetical protein